MVASRRWLVALLIGIAAFAQPPRPAPDGRSAQSAGDVVLGLRLVSPNITAHEPLFMYLTCQPAPGIEINTVELGSYCEIEVKDGKGSLLTPPFGWAGRGGLQEAAFNFGEDRKPQRHLLEVYRFAYLDKPGRYTVTVRLWPRSAPSIEAARPYAATSTVLDVGPFDSKRLIRLCEYLALREAGDADAVDLALAPAAWREAHPSLAGRLDSQRPAIMAAIRHPMVLPYATALAPLRPGACTAIRTSGAPQGPGILRAWAAGSGPLAAAAKAELKILASGEPPPPKMQGPITLPPAYD